MCVFPTPPLYQSKPPLSRLLPLGFTLEHFVPLHLCCRFAFLCTVCEYNTLLTLPHPPTCMDTLQNVKQTVKPELRSEKSFPVTAHTTKAA